MTYSQIEEYLTHLYYDPYCGNYIIPVKDWNDMLRSRVLQFIEGSNGQYALVFQGNMCNDTENFNDEENCYWIIADVTNF